MAWTQRSSEAKIEASALRSRPSSWTRRSAHARTAKSMVAVRDARRDASKEMTTWARLLRVAEMRLSKSTIVFPTRSTVPVSRWHRLPTLVAHEEAAMQVPVLMSCRSIGR